MSGNKIAGIDRIYNVRCGLGLINVLVRDGAIQLRGERNAVAQAAWYKLLGKNELGEDVDKRLATRKIIMTEIESRAESVRYEVYERFRATIKITWISIVRT